MGIRQMLVKLIEYVNKPLDSQILHLSIGATDNKWKGSWKSINHSWDTLTNDYQLGVFMMQMA